MSESPAPGVDGGNELSQNDTEETRFTIIILDIRFYGMVDWEDLTCSLMVRMKRSISVTCYFLDAQFRFMPRSVISWHSGSKSQ